MYPEVLQRLLRCIAPIGYLMSLLILSCLLEAKIVLMLFINLVKNNPRQIIKYKTTQMK